MSSKRFMRMSLQSGFAILITLLAWTAAACGAAAPPPAAAAAHVTPTYDKAGQLTRLEADSNGDGKIDTWGYMNGARVVRVEIDENGDGTVDRWEFHATGAAQGQAAPRGRGALD